MEEKNKDQLEKLFQSRLGAEDAAENGWNVPPDSVFENAMDSLPPKDDSRRRPILLILLLVGASALLTYYIFSTQQKIDTLNQELIEIKAQNENRSNDNERLAQQEETIEKNKFNTKEVPVQNTESASIAQTSEALNTPFVTPTAQLIEENLRSNTESGIAGASIFETSHTNETDLIIDSRDPGQGSSSVMSSSSNYLESSSVIVDNADEDLSTIERSSLNESVEAIPLLAIHIDERETELSEYGQSIIVNEQIQDNLPASPWSVRAYIGGNFSTMKMTNADNASFSLTEYDNVYSGYEIGLGASYQLSSRFYIDADILQACYVNKSVFENEETYEKTNEFVDNDGTLQYESNFLVVSPLHGMMINSRFAVDQVNPQQGDIIDHQTEINQELKTLGLALAVRYSLFKSSRFQFDLNTGLKTQYLIDLKDEMSMHMSLHGEEIMDKDLISYDVSDVNRMLYSWTFGIGGTYDLSQRFSMDLNVSYDLPLNSIRVQDRPEDAGTYIHSVVLKLGARYRF